MMAYLIEQFLDVREALEAERNKSTPSVRELEWLEERYERTKAAIDSAFEGLAVKIKAELLAELRRGER
jgi:hypothetical protein